MWIWVILKKIVQRSDQLVHPLYVAQPWIELGIHKQCPAHLLRNERHIQYVVVWFVNFGPLRCANQSCFWLCVHSVVQLRAAGMMGALLRECCVSRMRCRAANALTIQGTGIKQVL